VSSTSTKILLVGADRRRRDGVARTLDRGGFAYAVAEGRVEALHAMSKLGTRLLIAGAVGRNDQETIAFWSEVFECAPDIALIVFSHAPSVDFVVAALRAGARDYFELPLSDNDEFLLSVRRQLTREMRRAAAERGGRATVIPHTPLIGGSDAIRAVRRYLVRVAATDITVLITGETGTGKDRVAQLIHRHSARRKKPYISINCAAVPDTLLESELFGFEKGAFTGADSRFSGKLMQADGGTVLLDEIGEMSLYAQAKILRVIEEKEVIGLRSTASRHLDVRFVAATNQNLEAAVADGRFRKDLFYRLNAARIDLPSLADNHTDIPVLIEFYTNELRHKYDRQIAGIAPPAMKSLLAHGWPGNVRELKNILETVFATCPSDEVTLEDLPGYLQARADSDVTSRPCRDDRKEFLRVMLASRWNKTEAAKRLNCSRMTIYRTMAKYGIEPDGRSVRGIDD
jgi:DNA-binding NtrC family response regulator